jgi:hypothetical protein
MCAVGNRLLLILAGVKEKIKTETVNYLSLNDCHDISCQDLWDEAKVLLRGKCVALNLFNRITN